MPLATLQQAATRLRASTSRGTLSATQWLLLARQFAQRGKPPHATGSTFRKIENLK
jgi:uncharacterized protein HemY